MSLQFPTNPALGFTYQSGSSATYRWNGTYWETALPPTQIVLNSTNAANAISASFVATASLATFATSASRAVSSETATSASFSLSASFATSASRAVSASFATTAYNWNTPTVAIQGDPIFFVNNSSSTYGTATRMPMTSLTTTFIEGSMATGALGIQPGATGVYEIRMDGFVLDSGGNPTLLTCYIGVNGTARAQRLHTVPTSAYANFSISCVSSLNGGEIIDFRFGSSGGERIDIDGVSIFVRLIG
jgi:hypothetical protein